jgi:hypothetical protein
MGLDVLLETVGHPNEAESEGHRLKVGVGVDLPNSLASQLVVLVWRHATVPRV